jgi:hypothetical protein
LKRLGLDIEIFVADWEGRDSATNILNCDAGKLQNLLYSTNAARPYSSEIRPKSPFGVALLDVWSSTINIAVRKSASDRDPDSYMISLWSNGPNKRNEQGTGDDIVHPPFDVKIHTQ